MRAGKSASRFAFTKYEKGPLLRDLVEDAPRQMTLDEDLVTAVDRVARRSKTTRSSFTRDALRAALERHPEELERKHREGYRRHPVQAEEFSGWEKAQAWPD